MADQKAAPMVETMADCSVAKWDAMMAETMAAYLVAKWVAETVEKLVDNLVVLTADSMADSTADQKGN